METSKVDMFIMKYGKYFPANNIPFIREKLLKSDDSIYASLFASKFKDPFIALLLSIAVGPLGADRFYLQKPGTAIIKLILTIIYTVASITLQVYVRTNNVDVKQTLIVSGLCVVLVFAVVIWYFIDIFCAQQRAKEINQKLLLTILN